MTRFTRFPCFAINVATVAAFAMTFVPLVNVNSDALSTRLNNHYVHFLIVNLMGKKSGREKRRKRERFYVVFLSTAAQQNTLQKQGGACEQDYTGLVLLLGQTSSAGEIFSAHYVPRRTRPEARPPHTCPYTPAPHTHTAGDARERKGGLTLMFLMCGLAPWWTRHIAVSR